MERRDSGSFATPYFGTQHQVKGLFFIVARKHVLERYGEAAIERMASAVSPAHRGAILEPLPSTWYDEEALQEALAAFHDVVARGDDDEFLRALEACTLDGVNRFFQILVGLASPPFVLRKCPVLWRFVRRGPGTVTVDADDARALVSYRDFPYFDDRNYRLMMEGTLRAVATLAQPQAPLVVHRLRWDKTSLDVELQYR